MTGAMYAAISGLKSHMNKLNVIGNNIANVNTNGYKTGRMVFSTSLYTSMRSGSNGTTSVGGRNPAQIGYGAQVSTIDLDMSTGNYSPTGRALDCMISGDGFFLVGDKTTGDSIDPKKTDSLKSMTLTRVGNFGFDADGYLVDGAGSVVYGFLTTGAAADGTPQVCDQLVPIRYPRLATAADGKQSIAYPEIDANKKLTDKVGDDADNPNPIAQFDSVSIDEKTGKITGTCKDTDEVITIGFLAMGNVTNPNGVTQESGSYYKAGDGSGNLSISLLGGVAENIQGTGGTAFSNQVNGSMADDLNDLPAGMRIGSAGTTSLITNGLEMSKTDLATEISEMITTQRGYQANTRIITVTDAMLEELVNIKR